jgi:hypothetical protein
LHNKPHKKSNKLESAAVPGVKETKEEKSKFEDENDLDPYWQTNREMPGSIPS